MEEVAIKVESLHKTFKLPHEKVSSVKSLFLSAFNGKRTYEKQHVLKGVSFEIKKGEFFGIVGRNGSGKSTLLKLLAGIYTPNEGSIQVNGKLTPFIELGVGFNPELTGRENVYLNGALLGFNRKEMEAMYQEIVDFAEIERFMDQKLKNYSSGMQVRLAFSIAIKAESDILLLDEVLAVGDEAFQRKCFEYFETLKRNNKTVVLVTHDMGAVERFCSRAILIEKGNIVKSGSARVVAKAYHKLFSPQVKDQDPILRWGDERLRIEEVTTTVTTSKVDIALKIECRHQVDSDVYISYTVKNTEMVRPVFGARLLTSKLSKLKPRETLHTTISIPNILSNGKYSADLSIYSKDEETYCDFWTDAQEFAVNSGIENALSVITDSKLIFKE